MTPILCRHCLGEIRELRPSRPIKMTVGPGEQWFHLSTGLASCGFVAEPVPETEE